jgi:polysaccharide biosynthesis transport protein
MSVPFGDSLSRRLMCSCLRAVRKRARDTEASVAIDDNPPSTLRDYLGILRRRKWIIVQAVFLIPLVAVLWSSQQPEVYQASASVLVNTQNVAANLSGINDPSQLDAERILGTQVVLARVPEVARRAVKSARLDDWTGSDLLGASTVTSMKDSDVLTFTVSAREPPVAVKLVNEYARQFTLYRLELDTDALEAAIAAVDLRMKRLEAAGREDSALYANMADRRDSLETLRTLQTARATVVKEATGAGQTEPNPARTGVLGLIIGIALGLGLAFLREALDTRVRSAQEIADRLRMPLLGRLPRPRHAFPRRSPGLVTITDPDGPHAEAFRMLMSTIGLVNLEHRSELAEQRVATGREVHGAESIMLTSALEHEGKSTTAANLAVTFARAGKRVILVDLDFRNPRIHRLFCLDQTPGLTELATGEITLDEALQPVDVHSGVSTALIELLAQFPAQRADGPNGSTETLRVITSGAPVADPAWIVGDAFEWIVEQVRQQSDLVIVDGPPLLLTGDAVEAGGRIDALVMVARLNHVRRPMLDEVERILRQSPAIKLGFVATDAETESGYGYLARTYHWQKTPA